MMKLALPGIYFTWSMDIKYEIFGTYLTWLLFTIIRFLKDVITISISTQKQPDCEKEMATMMLMLINFNSATAIIKKI